MYRVFRIRDNHCMLVLVELLQGVRCSYPRLYVLLGAGIEQAGVRIGPCGVVSTVSVSAQRKQS